MAKITSDWQSKITGSAYSDIAGTISAPKGMVIIAIQALGSVGLTKLVAEDADQYANSVSRAHNVVRDTVDEGSGVSDAATFTMDTAYTSSGIAVGDYVFGTGVPYGTKLAAVNVGSSDVEITLDTNVTLADAAVLTFVTPDSSDRTTTGGGGEVMAAANKLAAGMTIYGRWLTVEPEADGDGGLMVYFGE